MLFFFVANELTLLFTFNLGAEREKEKQVIKGKGLDQLTIHAIQMLERANICSR